MNITKIVFRNLKKRRLSTILTSSTVALGVALFSLIGSLREASQQGFQRTAALCDTLVGAKGDGLQLTLNALYHLSFSQGNFPVQAYKDIVDLKGIQWSAPLALGDSYKNYRIVGTTSDFFYNAQIQKENLSSFFSLIDIHD